MYLNRVKFVKYNATLLLVVKSIIKLAKIFNLKQKKQTMQQNFGNDDRSISFDRVLIPCGPESGYLRLVKTG